MPLASSDPNLVIQTLTEKLARPLPGSSAHQQMARFNRAYTPRPDKPYRDAAVLISLYPVKEEWHFVLIKRVDNSPNDRHGGQISLPGGKVDPEDKSLQHTALREFEEEVGVPRSAIYPIGALSPLFIPVSNFMVHPFVGVLNKAPTFRAQASEVQEIIETPLPLLFHPETLREKDIIISNSLILPDVPYFDVKGHVVWGATAMMLAEFKEVLSD